MFQTSIPINTHDKHVNKINNNIKKVNRSVQTYQYKSIKCLNKTSITINKNVQITVNGNVKNMST